MITRFAPSPTGPLHLGHAYSAMTAHDMARAGGGTFLLRMEDIDRARSKPKWEQQIFDDLRWLGLDWPTPVWRQSERLPVYRGMLQRLWDVGLLYPCTCSRRDILDAASAPQEGALLGPDGIVYPGTCRSAPRTGPLPDAVLRLDSGLALTRLTQNLNFTDEGTERSGHHSLTCKTFIQKIGDVVLARRDFGTSYHLAVVSDDAVQNVTHVVRGVDLFDATFIHVLLQRLLDLPTPRYLHHRLIRDATGRRLAKRDDARAIALFRAEGATPGDIRRMVSL